MPMNVFRTFLGSAFRWFARGLFAVTVLPGLYILEPFYRIRLGIVTTQRFGELAANMDFFVRHQQHYGNPPRTAYLLFGWEPSNRQLFRMFKRLARLNVLETRWGTWLLFALRPILTRTRFWHSFRWDNAHYFLFNNTKSELRFTEAEEKDGKARLAEMGIGENDWFVCFHAREDSYYRQWRPEAEDMWRAVDFKNTRIENYLKAAEYITSLGGFAIRIGAAVDIPLPETVNPRIIDYATKYRNDFMDIYLLAKNRFLLGTSSGPYSVPIAFDVPLVVSSHFPYSHSPNHSFDIILPRPVITYEDHQPVGFYEAAEQGFYTTSTGGSELKYLHLYQWGESDADDILDGCKDMIDQLEGRAPSAEARELQSFYAGKYLGYLPDHQLAGKVGARWALKHRALIVPDETATAHPKAASRQ